MDKENNHQIKPILKWFGGKSRLLKYILPLVPNDFDRYVEPFFGGGAVAFALQPKHALLNDKNQELINLYRVLQHNPKELIKRLEEFEENHDENQYYEVRAWDRNTEFYHGLSEIEQAARTVYLNKTCFNGLYRVNSKGFFNSPIGHPANGTRNLNICDAKSINEIHSYLSQNDVHFVQGSYEKVLEQVKKGDFVYLDPPYMPVSKTESFTNYTKDGFDINEQIRLKRMCDKLSEKGIRFLQSNSDNPYIWDLYKDYKIERIPVRRLLAAKKESRKEIYEVLIRNYDL